MSQPLPPISFAEIVPEILRGVVDTVADRPHWTMDRRADAQKAAVCSVMAFNPRDPVELMMAGQCVVYDHMMRKDARDLLRGNDDQGADKVRRGILSAGKLFLSTVAALRRMQGRAEASLAFARSLPQPDEAPEPPAEPPVQAPDAVADPWPEPAAAAEIATPPPETAAPADPPPAVPDAARAEPASAEPSAPATAAPHSSPTPPAADASPVAGSDVGQTPADLPAMSREEFEDHLFDDLDPSVREEFRRALTRPARPEP